MTDNEKRLRELVAGTTTCGSDPCTETECRIARALLALLDAGTFRYDQIAAALAVLEEKLRPYLVRCECGWESQGYKEERQAKEAAEAHEDLEHDGGAIGWEWIQ
jgi:hypothetical protein